MQLSIQKQLLRFFAVLMAGCSLFAYAETLTEYVNSCKTEVGFTTIPNMHCDQGLLFAPTSSDFVNDPVNDFVGYKRINDKVDLTFACRWFQVTPTITPDSVFSLELIIHNRQNGKTCFFRAREEANLVPAAIVSPTDQTLAQNGKTAAENYWLSPVEVDAGLRCVNCHSAGPYIASPRIAPFLARFGLLNNGHDTFANMSAQGHYSAVGNGVVGSAFNAWDSIISTTNVARAQTCAAGCHAVGYNSTDRGASFFFFTLVPALSTVIGDVTTLGAMPLEGQPLSDYRWANMDNPSVDSPAGEGDYETLIGLQQQYPGIYCSNPTAMEARVVGSSRIMNPSAWVDKLKTFNLRDGLVCLNADQGGGTCHDYQTSYYCGTHWMGSQNIDDPSGNGDFERRSNFSNLCANPTMIRAKYNAGTAQSPDWVWLYGPNDRLAQFDNKGLVCKNADQGAGQVCSNYGVRFACDTTTSVPSPTPLARNVNSGNMGTGEKTYVVTVAVNGWQASNTTGRQIYINGVPVTPGQWPLPPRTGDGKYYITFTAGGQSYASWSFW